MTPHTPQSGEPGFLYLWCFVSVCCFLHVVNVLVPGDFKSELIVTSMHLACLTVCTVVVDSRSFLVGKP